MLDQRPPTYLQSAQVAQLLQVSPSAVKQWARQGKLPHIRTLGGHRRYPETEIRELAIRLGHHLTP
jgi:excisionase family DNA binding protein